MNRREFTKGCVAAASAMALGRVCAQKHAPTGDPDLDGRQDEIDAITPQDFKAYWTPGTQLPGDQLAEQFKFAMDRVQHKPVVNNFLDNYGEHDGVPFALALHMKKVSID